MPEYYLEIRKKYQKVIAAASLNLTTSLILLAFLEPEVTFITRFRNLAPKLFGRITNPESTILL